jgi:energy-coupling factor transporter ATP-binding protein EcfA2
VTMTVQSWEGFRDEDSDSFALARVEARMAKEAPRVPWDMFVNTYFAWRQGEHLAIIGPTNQGKTTLLMNLLPYQPYVVVFATKPSDDSMDRLIESGYLRLEKWARIPPERAPRRVLWPTANKLGAEEYQAEVFHDAFARIYRERGWCVAIDEGWFIANVLKLSKDVKTYLLQARSLFISLVFATQRPAFVPLEVYDQSTHLFFFRDSDRRNIERLAGINARNANLVRELIPNLDSHQFLYVNTRTGAMVRSRAPIPDEGR